MISCSAVRTNKRQVHSREALQSMASNEDDYDHLYKVVLVGDATVRTDAHRREELYRHKAFVDVVYQF